MNFFRFSNYFIFPFICFIDFYKYFISPFKINCCRFYPSCSSYARESLTNHGFLKGSFFSIIRICKCHPFHAGGFDPVPPSKNQEKK